MTNSKKESGLKRENTLKFQLLRFLRRNYSPYLYINSWNYDNIDGGGKVVLGLEIQEPRKGRLKITQLDKLCEVEWSFKIKGATRNQMAKLAKERMKSK